MVLAGGIAAAFVAFRGGRLNREQERRFFLTRKYEEMSLAFSSSLEWIGGVASAKNIVDLQRVMDAPDAHRIKALCALYFQELHDLANSYLDAHRLYFQAIVTNLGAEEIKQQLESETAREEPKDWKAVLDQAKLLDGAASRRKAPARDQT